MLIVANLFLSMTQVPIAAILTDVTDLTNRNEAFSLTYLAANAGFAFGPIIAGFLFENYTSMIFLGNGIASLIGFIIFCGIKETKPNTMAYKDVKLDSVNNNSLEENLNIGYISAIEASINQDNTGSNIENKAIVSLDNKDKNIPGQKTNDLIFDNETDGEKVAIKNQSK